LVETNGQGREFPSRWLGQQHGCLAAFAQATTVAIVIELASSGAAVDPIQGALIGSLLGFGLAAASSLSHRLFAGNGFRVWIIEVGSDIVNLTLMGLVIASFG
jgi:hypothetical protein